MKDTITPFLLGGNIMIEIIENSVRQLDAVTGNLIKSISADSLSAEQRTKINGRRNDCAKASIAQGFKPEGWTNEK